MCGHPELDCDYTCLVYWYNFSFKVVDKNTGADLVFGANPRYTTNDIKLYYDAAGTRPAHGLQIDATNKKFKLMAAREELYLFINTQSYRLDLTFRPESCCSSIVKDLKIDNQQVCTCCNEVIHVPVN